MPEAMNLHVRLAGPTVEGRSPAIIDALTASAVTEVADYTRFEVLMQLNAVLQHPTGYYESQIRDQPVTRYMHRVNDSDVVYGPWLEGVGSRNYPVTRFKGYHTFRIVRNRMAQKTQAILAAHFARIGGLL